MASKMITNGGKEWFKLCAQGSQSMEYFGVKGISGGGLRWLTFNGGEPIRGYESRVVLTSP